jgi:preprotein translocase subunit SecA
MDYLKEGIGLRAMAQRDPLVEYQREGYHMFQAMNEAIKEETVGYLFNLEVKVEGSDAAEATTVVQSGAVAAESGGQATITATPVPADSDPQTVTAGRPAGSAKTSAGRAARAARSGAAGTANAGGSSAVGSPAPDGVASGQARSGQPEPAKGQARGPLKTPARVLAKGLEGPSEDASAFQYSAPSEDGSDQPVVRRAGTTASAAGKATDVAYPGTGRNKPCPCGSGKKYKMCHGKDG